jgi:hypothetical protein
MKNASEATGFLSWLYTICWGSKTIQKIRHVGSDFFYTWIGPTNKERSHVSIES